jgi:hypothetical protein
MNATNRWKLATVLLLLCSLALAYRVLDQGITRTYVDASEETSRRHIDLLTGLVGHEWRGLPEEQVMSRLKSYVDSQPAGSIVLKRDADSGAIYLEGIRFEFSNGKLVSAK